MTKTIMFIDDEQQILRALNRLFIDSPYTIILMPSAEDALVYLKDNMVNLVISDIRMPGMNGFDFLKTVKERYPETMRVALSGFTDAKSIFKSLESNVAKMYIFKPWDNQDLRETVDKLFEIEALLKGKKIMDTIINLEDIPTVPVLYQKIRQMIYDEEDVDKIAAVIESDQATASKILRIANSAFYSAKTGSVQQAIMYIGLMSVKSIVLSNSVFNLSGRSEKAVGAVWKNATLTNRYTGLIYQKFLGKSIPNIFATAGLLHNIGMGVLFHQNSSRYSAFIEEAKMSHHNLLELERDALGITHQELGGYLLNWWEMPLPIVETAFYHHTPLDQRVINKELLCAVHIASEYAWRKTNGDEYLSTRTSYLKDCCKFLKIDPAMVAEYFDAQQPEDINV